MTASPPRTHRQFRRVEARYRGAASTGWYQADIGELAPLVSMPVWVYATWAPFEVNLIGSRSEEHVVLVDNTYVSSFAFNFAKIELGAHLFPGQDDYADLMVGNLKKFVAEQRYLLAGDVTSMCWIIEYLIEYNGRNRTLDSRLRARPDGLALMHVLSRCATLCLLLHELGHVAFAVGDYRFRLREPILRHIEAVVGPRPKMERLEEEVFCDTFAMVNSIGLMSREAGWEPSGLREVCLHALLSALMCLKTREAVVASLSGGALPDLDPACDLLMARYVVTARVVDEVISESPEWFALAPKPLPFGGDTLGLCPRWSETLQAMPVRDPETRNIAGILAGAFADRNPSGFDHVMRSLNQLSPLSDLSNLASGFDIRQWSGSS